MKTNWFSLAGMSRSEMTAGLEKMRVERATYYYWKYDKKDDIIQMDTIQSYGNLE
ncbi:MAG: hypothetical protein Q8K92_08750 [Leadbetterella sp.]|nr:hypothetical protein [Leadbetterella sp.]